MTTSSPPPSAASEGLALMHAAHAHEHEAPVGFGTLISFTNILQR
jgi:hypothetical protein